MIKEMEVNKIYLGDCLEVMKDIPDESIDMILADLPYGTTACKWDTIIPFEPLWEQYKRIIKDNGAIVLTAKQPFTSILLLSNLDMFKYELVWQKEKGTDFGNANKKPLNSHENILVFYRKSPTYNKQFLMGVPYERKATKTFQKGDRRNVEAFGNLPKHTGRKSDGNRFPISVIKISKDNNLDHHPTQKPVELFAYLIKTYTNEGDLVLDNCAGSFTTAIACEMLKRNWICIEKEKEYCEIGQKRLDAYRAQKKLF